MASTIIGSDITGRFLVELASGGWLPFAFVFSQAIVADTDVAPSLIRRLSAVATDPVTPGKSTGCCLGLCDMKHKANHAISIGLWIQSLALVRLFYPDLRSHC